MRRTAIATAAWLVCATVVAAPPVVEAESLKLSGEVGQPIPIRTKTTGKFTEFRPIDKGLYLFPADLLADKKATVASASKAGTYRVLAYSGNADGPGPAIEIVVTIGVPEVDPKVDPKVDPIPPPKPVDPVPVPVSSFKILMIYESMKNHTAAEKAVLEGRVVEEWMTANCTGGKSGWIRRDKDTDPAEDTSAFRDAWAAIKADLASRPNQKYPCTAVVVNHKAEILLLEPTPEAMVKVFTKFREGK